MPTEIPKKEMPVVPYTPVQCKDGIAMMTVIQNGVIILYTDLDQIRYASWEEIAEFVATAKLEPRKEPEKEPATREIKGPDKPPKH